MTFYNLFIQELKQSTAELLAILLVGFITYYISFFLWRLVHPSPHIQSRLKRSYLNCMRETNTRPSHFGFKLYSFFLVLLSAIFEPFRAPLRLVSSPNNSKKTDDKIQKEGKKRKTS